MPAAMPRFHESEQICRETTIESLPNEVLEQISIILSPSDRLSCALTCRRWARIACASHMLADCRLVVFGPTEMEYVENALLNSERMYRRLDIYGVPELKYNSLFWERIGPALRKLRLVDCTLQIEVLYSLLRKCPMLESFEFSGAVGQAAPTSSSELLDDCPCLLMLRDLSLFNHRDGAVNQLDYIPSLTSSALSKLLAESELYLSTHDLLGLMLKLSPNIISFSFRKCFRLSPPTRLSHMFRNMKQSMVKSDFNRTFIQDEELIQIMDLCSTTLRELILQCCFDLTQRTWSMIPKCTNKLRCLSIGDEHLTDHQVKEIVLATDLEKLDLRYSPGIRGAGLLDIHRWKHLRHLDLPYNVRFRVISGLLGRISTLQYLNLSAGGLDIAFFRELATLKNLRTLIILRNDINITPECFEVICNNFRKLRRLSVQHLDNLTNADGVKLNLLEDLEYLNIDGKAEFTDLTPGGDVSLSALKTLAVHSDVIASVGLVKFAARHPRLENLFIFRSEALTDDALISMLGREPNLRRLGLMRCPQVTDRSLEALRNLCPRLRWLGLEHCQGTTDRGWHLIGKPDP